MPRLQQIAWGNTMVCFADFKSPISPFPNILYASFRHVNLMVNCSLKLLSCLEKKTKTLQTLIYPRLHCLFKHRLLTEIVTNRRIVTQISSESTTIEPHREKTGLLPMRKQRRRSASQ